MFDLYQWFVLYLSRQRGCLWAIGTAMGRYDWLKWHLSLTRTSKKAIWKWAFAALFHAAKMYCTVMHALVNFILLNPFQKQPAEESVEHCREIGKQWLSVCSARFCRWRLQTFWEPATKWHGCKHRCSDCNTIVNTITNFLVLIWFEEALRCWQYCIWSHRTLEPICKLLFLKIVKFLEEARQLCLGTPRLLHLANFCKMQWQQIR